MPTGRGISPEDREAVFGLFVQAEDIHTRSAGGLGIGLYVVKRLCDAMGVTIAVSPVDGGGTRFTIDTDGQGDSQPGSCSLQRRLHVRDHQPEGLGGEHCVRRPGTEGARPTVGARP